MRVLGVIPARMASTRLPGKPLVDIHGVPMVGHCYLRACLSQSLDAVWMATCDGAIDLYARSIGAPCVMTSGSHERATERAAEALASIERSDGGHYDYVALIQGDEPLLRPGMVDDLVGGLEAHPEVPIINLVARMKDINEFESPDIIKVVGTLDNQALYFSREPIPSRRNASGDVPMWKQLGMILFSREALLAYAELRPTPLEIVESVDMNRFLEHGWVIRLAPTVHESRPVDTLEDLEIVRELMARDDLLRQYQPALDAGSR